MGFQEKPKVFKLASILGKPLANLSRVLGKPVKSDEYGSTYRLPGHKSANIWVETYNGQRRLQTISFVSVSLPPIESSDAAREAWRELLKVTGFGVEGVKFVPPSANALFGRLEGVRGIPKGFACGFQFMASGGSYDPRLIFERLEQNRAR